MSFLYWRDYLFFKRQITFESNMSNANAMYKCHGRLKECACVIYTQILFKNNFVLMKVHSGLWIWSSLKTSVKSFQLCRFTLTSLLPCKDQNSCVSFISIQVYGFLWCIWLFQSILYLLRCADCSGYQKKKPLTRSGVWSVWYSGPHRSSVQSVWCWNTGNTLCLTSHTPKPTAWRFRILGTNNLHTLHESTKNVLQPPMMHHNTDAKGK